MTTTEIYGEDEQGNEIPLLVEYSSVPFVRGVHTLRNGDPGYPDEGGYAEIEGVYAILPSGKKGEELTGNEIAYLGIDTDDLSVMLYEEAEARNEDYEACAAEDAYEARRDNPNYCD